MPSPPSSSSLFPVCASFVRGATSVPDFPETTYPEIAFVGRSNVGKSSLINTLLNRKNLAHTSKKPGKTAQINFFTVGDRFILVDMPGYGYAAVSQKIKTLWGSLIPAYFKKRAACLHTFVLIDSRHPPQKTDRQVLEFLMHEGKPFTCILTKTDKTPKALLETRLQELQQLTQGARLEGVFFFNVKEPLLRDHLHAHILKILP